MTARTASTPPLVVTQDGDLREAVLRLCVAASVSPEVVTDLDLVRRGWVSASCVLVGADCAAAVSALGLPRRREVILVCEPPETAALWRAAVSIHAEHLAVIPEADGWLVERLSDSIDGAVDAVTVGVVGARGGAGASTLAVALGLTAARRGSRALLVDADPLGGGLELAVGCEWAAGLRWADVAATRGRVGAAALRSSLPSADGLAVLSWGQAARGSTLSADPDPVIVGGVLTAGRRGADVVIVDLPRQAAPMAPDAVRGVETVLLVCTADVRSTAAGCRMLALLEAWCGDIRLVIRQRRGDGLDAEAVAAAIGRPVAALVPTQRGVARSVDEGLGPLGRGSLERRCAQLLDDLGVRAGRAR